MLPPRPLAAERNELALTQQTASTLERAKVELLATRSDLWSKLNEADARTVETEAAWRAAKFVEADAA